jgi:phosphoglycolate phosphatase
MIQAIFFDFNGVIINDEPLQMAAYQNVLAEHGIELTENEYYDALGMDDRAFVRAAFQRSGKPLTDDLLASTIDGKSAHHRKLIEDELPLFPGVVTFLKAASRTFSLGLVSMARLVEIDYVLDRAQLRSLFSVIVTAEDVNACKPAPDCYRSALEKLNKESSKNGRSTIAAADCLVVEDAPPGVESGKQAGMRTLGVTNTVSEQQLRTAGADVVTRSLADWTVDAVQRVFS